MEPHFIVILFLSLALAVALLILLAQRRQSRALKSLLSRVLEAIRNPGGQRDA
jgi:hypothetical protein